MYRLVIVVISLILILQMAENGQNIGFFASLGVFFAMFANDYIKMGKQGNEENCVIKTGTANFCKSICTIWVGFCFIGLIEVVKVTKNGQIEFQSVIDYSLSMALFNFNLAGSMTILFLSELFSSIVLTVKNSESDWLRLEGKKDKGVETVNSGKNNTKAQEVGGR